LKTMSREYFTMLGTLSSSPRGLEILGKFQVFKYLIELSELQGRDDLCNLIMTSLDYNMAGEARVILGKALNSPSTVVRYLATRHMRVLLRAGVHDFKVWGIDFLVKQIDDKDGKVASVALSLLDEACDEVESMDTLILRKPQLHKMGEAGRTLLCRFLSRPNGVKYLIEINFLDPELKLWKEKTCLNYVVEVERALAEIFSPSLYKQRESENTGDVVHLKPHFYGELAKTEDGLKLLDQSKHVLEFVACLKNATAPALQKRAALWVLGNIAGSKTGFGYLTKMDVPTLIVNLAQTSTSLSVRGTAFYALGIMARTEVGRAALYPLGWESPNLANNTISVPKSTQNQFFRMPKYKHEGSFAEYDFPYPKPEKDEEANEVLKNVTHLSNFISAESASRTLKRIKTQSPQYFANPTFVLKIFELLGIYKFRLPVRRFIYEIFDDVVWDKAAFDAIDKVVH